MLAQVTSLGRFWLPSSGLDVVALACAACFVAVIVTALVSKKFRDDMLGGATSEAKVLGLLTVRGAAMIVLVLGLGGLAIFAGKAGAESNKVTSTPEEIAAVRTECQGKIKALKTTYEADLKTREDAITNLRDENIKLKVQLEDSGDPDPARCIEKVTVKAVSGKLVKDRREPITYTLKDGDSILASDERGKGDTWRSRDSDEFELALKPPIPESRKHGLVFEVQKTPCGEEADGEPWDVSFDIRGELGDGSAVDLITTPQIRLGGGCGSERLFVPEDKELVDIVVSRREVQIVAERQHMTGLVLEGKVMAPIREVGEALGITVNADLENDRVEIQPRDVTVYVGADYRTEGWVQGDQVMVSLRDLVESRGGAVHPDMEGGVVRATF